MTVVLELSPEVETRLAAKAAQTITLGAAGVVVATTNVGHLSRFVAARQWQDVA